jgi:hypothetical protein
MGRYSQMDILQDPTKVAKTGDTMTGNLALDGGKTVDDIDLSGIPTTYVPLTGATLTGNLNFQLASIPVATDNATAATATVAVGGLYRTNADPSVLMIRTA